MKLTEKLINGELLNQDSLVVRHERLVHKVCSKFKFRAETLGMEYEDIVSVGFIGMIRAFENFDGELYPVRFSTYAIPMIMGEVRRYLRDQNPGAKFSRTIKDIAHRIYKTEMEHLPIDVIVSSLDVEREKVIHALNYIRNHRVTRLDEPIYKNSEDEDLTIMNLLHDEEDESLIFVKEFIESLSNRDQIIVKSLMAGMPQSDIGKELGISQVQVSRLQKKIGVRYLAFSGLAKPNQEKKVMAIPKKPKGDMVKAKELLLEGKLAVREIAKLTGTNIGTLNTYKSKLRNKAEKLSRTSEVAI